MGAVSYTLGGGLGILAREFGYAADHVRSVDVVTADARLRTVSADAEPELFHGLLGGGPYRGAVRRTDAEEARRCEGRVRPGEPLPEELQRALSARGENYLLANFQAVGSTPIARAAFTASPMRNGVRPAATACVRVMPVAAAR